MRKIGISNGIKAMKQFVNHAVSGWTMRRPVGAIQDRACRTMPSVRRPGGHVRRVMDIFAPLSHSPAGSSY